MSADIGSVLAEQRAVVTLLMKRCQATDQPTPTGVESFLQALFGHMTVLERVVLPALGRSKHAGGVAAALRISAAHLAETLAEQRVDSHLCDSIPLLFVAETLLLRDAPHVVDRRILPSLAEDAERQFLVFLASDEPSEVRAASLSLWS